MPTLATAVLLPFLLCLGGWQWHRAAVKQQRLDQFAQRAQQAPQPLTGHEPVYTPVQVTGYYDVSHLILLDNRIVNHQVGYDVLAPFIPADGESAVLVNQGWIPRASCHSRVGLPLSCAALQISAGATVITGLTQAVEPSFLLAKPHLESEPRWPLLVEDVRLDALSHILNRPLYPFILLLSGHEGFVHHWEVIASVSPQRHRAYAVQWFGLALTLIVLYIKLNVHRRT
jgi:surfeit locus 1 family protein